MVVYFNSKRLEKNFLFVSVFVFPSYLRKFQVIWGYLSMLLLVAAEYVFLSKPAPPACFLFHFFNIIMLLLSHTILILPSVHWLWGNFHVLSRNMVHNPQHQPWLVLSVSLAAHSGIEIKGCVWIHAQAGRQRHIQKTICVCCK